MRERSPDRDIEAAKGGAPYNSSKSLWLRQQAFCISDTFSQSVVSAGNLLNWYAMRTLRFLRSHGSPWEPEVQSVRRAGLRKLELPVSTFPS